MTTFNRPRPISDLVPGLTKDIFGKKNLLFGKLIAQWADIVGPDIAAHTMPVELKFQRKTEKEKGGSPQAVLLLGVQPAFALEFSYQKNLMVERLNAFFGYPAIKEIKIIQDSSIMDNKKPKPVKIKPLTLQEQQLIEAVTADIKDNDLQTALKNLGKAIASRKE